MPGAAICSIRDWSKSPSMAGIAARESLLPDMHGDPADRLIVATALEGHQLVTADHQLLQWPGHLSRLRATE